MKINIIEPGFTGEFQVMDLVVNRAYKTSYRKYFREYCLETVKKAKVDKPADAIRLDFGIKVIKNHISGSISLLMFA